MARHLLRTGGEEQVAPDAILFRRSSAPYSWDVPVSQATQTSTLMGANNIFEGVDLELRLVGTTEGKPLPAPRISYGGRRLFTVTSKGRDTPKTGSRGTSLWTITSKMTCPSFSLPAGPTTESGSCVAANQSKRGGGLRTSGKTYICDGCYSLEGQYIYPNVSEAQAARQTWVLQHLEADPSGEALGAKLGDAIEDYARNTTLHTAPNASAIRMTQELGVWDGSAIRVPVYVPPLGQVKQAIACPTELPSFTGASNSHDWIARQRPRPDSVVGFFRIHDSGDFTPGTNARLWPGYIRAWGLVAARFPFVRFWGPTRIWVMPQLLGVLREVCAGAPNLVIRPSGLNVNDPAPVIDGLGPGTTVSKMKGKKGNKTFVPTTDVHGRPTWSCPVYLKDMSKSCMAAGCRACWISDEPVAYGWH